MTAYYTISSVTFFFFNVENYFASAQRNLISIIRYIDSLFPLFQFNFFPPIVESCTMSFHHVESKIKLRCWAKTRGAQLQT